MFLAVDTSKGILVDGKLDMSRIFNSDECPNPMNGQASGTRSRPKVLYVKKDGKFHRPTIINTEKHDENITVDPIISGDGKLWTTQVINIFSVFSLFLFLLNMFHI